MIFQNAAERDAEDYRRMKAQEFKGPDTYLNGHSKGWPHDHSVDDAYEAPLFTMKPKTAPAEEREFKASFGPDGSSKVWLHTPPRLIGSFETHADAQLAAEALNNYKGY